MESASLLIGRSGCIKICVLVFPDRQAESGRELRLAESHFAPNTANIDLRHVDQRHANVVVLSLGPRDRLLQSFDNTLADGLALSRPRRFFHGRFGYLFHWGAFHVFSLYAICAVAPYTKPWREGVLVGRIASPYQNLHFNIGSQETESQAPTIVETLQSLRLHAPPRNC